MDSSTELLSSIRRRIVDISFIMRHYLPFTNLNCMQRLLTWLITFFSGSFKEHQVQFKVLAMQYGLNNFQCQESVVYNAERSALFDAFFIDFREEQLLQVSMSDTKFLN
ncbi:hypothetical protein T4A_7469, partial [Trichinella pseudospiralis]